MVALNPWVDATDRAAERVGEMSQVGVWKNRLFREIRGQRMIFDARTRLQRIAADEFGMTSTESMALFDHIMKAADANHMTPRGLSGDELWQLANTHALPKALKAEEKWNQSEVVEMILRAFQGEFWHTGVTQAFTVP